MTLPRIHAHGVLACTFSLGIIACGGGNPVTPPAATGGGIAGPTGMTVTSQVTGAIANMVGDYLVCVIAFDCSAGNQNPTAMLALQANGSYKVTTAATGGLPANVTPEREF